MVAILDPGASSFLAIMGGALFLVLPVAFLNGTVSIVRISCSTFCREIFLPPTPDELASGIVQPMSAVMVSFLAILGTIGMLLGLFAVKLSNAWDNFTEGLAFSLGSMAIMFSAVALCIRVIFITTPASYLAFPFLSVMTMAAATVLFRYGPLRETSGKKPPDAAFGAHLFSLGMMLLVLDPWLWVDGIPVPVLIGFTGFTVGLLIAGGLYLMIKEASRSPRELDGK